MDLLNSCSSGQFWKSIITQQDADSATVNLHLVTDQSRILPESISNAELIISMIPFYPRLLFRPNGGTWDDGTSQIDKYRRSQVVESLE